MSNSVFKEYENKELFLITGLDSIGVPYTPDNYLLYSYTDFIVSKFKEHGISIDYFNLHSLAISKTHQLIKILQKDYTKSFYNRINKRMTEYVIAIKQFRRPLNPKFLEDYFKEPENDINITSKLINAERPMFILSCGAMDLKENLNIYTYEAKKYIPKIIFEFNEELNNAMNNIEEYINYILKLNSSTKIYILGGYPLAKNGILEKMLWPYVIFYNKKLIELCEKYDNVSYVDIFQVRNYMCKNDGHPSLEGHMYIGNQIIETMNQEYQRTLNKK